MVARAVEDPTDSLAVVAALRTAAFGCGDDDLYVWRQTHGGRWDHQRPPPSSAPDGDIVGRGLSWLGTAAPGAALAGAQPDPRAHRAGAAAHGGGVRAPPAPGSVAAAALRRRPVPGLGGGRRHHVAGVPGVGPPAVGRGGAGDRDRAAGDRRRCRAHPHHPRGQGPRVSDHRAVGPDDAAQPATGWGPGALPARRALGRASQEGPGNRRVRRLPAHRGTDGPARAPAPPVRGGHPGPRPFDRVGAPQGGIAAGRRRRGCSHDNGLGSGAGGGAGAGGAAGGGWRAGAAGR